MKYYINSTIAICANISQVHISQLVLNIRLVVKSAFNLSTSINTILLNVISKTVYISPQLSGIYKIAVNSKDIVKYSNQARHFRKSQKCIVTSLVTKS